MRTSRHGRPLAGIGAAGAAAYRAFLESKEEARDVVVRYGEVFRFKYDSEKTFMGFWGETVVSRRLYQNASDSKSFFPLDAAWDMEDEYLMADVREAVAFSCAHHMPEERFPTFKARFEAELLAAQKQAPDAIKVLLCDGVRSLWKYIEELKHFADYEAILDFWHAAEHLALAADALFGKGSRAARDWYAKYRASCSTKTTAPSVSCAP